MFGRVMYLPGTVLVLFASTVTSLLPGSSRLETTSAAPVMFSCCVGAQRDEAADSRSRSREQAVPRVLDDHSYSVGRRGPRTFCRVA